MNRAQWISHAYVESAKYVRRMTKPRTMEQIRISLAKRVPEPADLRWWGGVCLLLINGNHIERVHFAPAKSSHGASKPTYMPCRAQFSRGCK
jgi:hypothetical protein